MNYTQKYQLGLKILEHQTASKWMEYLESIAVWISCSYSLPKAVII